MFPPVFELINLNGTNGFSINGIRVGDQLGGSVRGAGDINGDGLQDLIIGASEADPNSLTSAGQSYVILGQRGTTRAANFNVSALNGSNGFRLNGTNALDFTGYAVSGAGDVNGDGLDDLLIGAFGNDTRGASAGQSYVVFGQSNGFAADLELSSLNGSNGFLINGVSADDFSGFAVSGAGDVNGDGLDDLFIGAYGANPGSRFVGQGYVVFGQQGNVGAIFNLSALVGSNGFQIDGVNPEDQAGYSVTRLGDINGDRLDDLLIGAPHASANGFASGQAYVIFGRSGGFPGTLSLSSLNGSTGFRLDGLAQEDNLGFSIGAAGDFNGDGLNDFVIGAPNADPKGLSSGQSYVIFGQSGGFPATVNLIGLNGINGFQINGIKAEDQAGAAVGAAGDLNNDGYDDLLIGAPGADPNGLSSGQTYVLFGRSGTFPSQFNLDALNGSNGFRINGSQALDRSGRSLSRLGDFNGDGIDDLLIGSPEADPDGNSSAGQAHVIFGVAGPILGLSLVSPTVNASRLNGPLTANLQSGQLSLTVSSRTLQRAVGGYANIQGSDYSDNLTGSDRRNFIVGNRGHDRINGLGDNDRLSGGVGNDTCYGGVGNDDLAGNQGNDSLVGEGGNDRLSGGVGNDYLVGGVGNDDLAGNESNDYLVGGVGNDTLAGGSENDDCYGGVGNDDLAGNGGNDHLLGEDGNDLLTGGNENDVLIGGEGNDTLWGSYGVDRVRGGAGSDRILFNIGRAFRQNLIRIDRLVDFNPNVDKIVLDRTTFTAFRNNTPSFAKVSTLKQASRSTALITYIESRGALIYNANGAQAGFGGGGQFAFLQNHPALTSTNFIVQS